MGIKCHPSLTLGIKNWPKLLKSRFNHGWILMQIKLFRVVGPSKIIGRISLKNVRIGITKFMSVITMPWYFPMHTKSRTYCPEHHYITVNGLAFQWCGSILNNQKSQQCPSLTAWKINLGIWGEVWNMHWGFCTLPGKISDTLYHTLQYQAFHVAVPGTAMSCTNIAPLSSKPWSKGFVPYLGTYLTRSDTHWNINLFN